MTMQLIYRAQTFEYTPRPIQLDRQTSALDTNSGEKTIKLIYRAQTFERTLPPVQPYQRPRAINWRWQGLLEQGTQKQALSVNSSVEKPAQTSCV